MNKRESTSFIEEYVSESDMPLSQEIITGALFAEAGIANPSSRIAGKAREYVRDFIKSNLMDNIAGGVIYPRKIPVIKGETSGFYKVWVKLIKLAYKEGTTFGNRTVLPDVSIRDLDMRLGSFHYRDVGYTSSNIVKTWMEYFDDEEIIKFRKSIDMRIGYSILYRCGEVDTSGGWHSPCLDSITVTALSSKSVLVKANYRVSNLNRMCLVDFYLLHRFIRMVIPDDLLCNVKISLHYGILSLDLDQMGWLARVPGLRNHKIMNRYVYPKITEYKRIELARDFGQRGGGRPDFGVNTFINNNYLLGGLHGSQVNPQIDYFSC